MYGSRPLLAGVEFIRDALTRHKHGMSAEAIVEQEVKRHHGQVRIMGYTRPLVTGDERVPAMERVTADLGFAPGEHLTLAYEIERILRREYGERININGYVSAFLSDQGLSAEQVYRVFSLCVMSGVTACFVEEQDKAPGSFLPLRCDDMDYQGKGPRQLPPRSG